MADPTLQANAYVAPDPWTPPWQYGGLSFYEEGRFIPTLNFDGGNGDFSYTTSTLNAGFVRVGRMCRVGARINCGTNFTHTTATGNFYIGGLPYVSTGTPSYLNFMFESPNLGTSDVTAIFGAFSAAAPARMYPRYVVDGGSSTMLFGTTELPSGTNFELRFWGWYPIAAHDDFETFASQQNLTGP